MTDDEQDTADEAVVSAWCEGRQWVRCDLCETVIDREECEPGEPAFVVTVDDSRVVRVRCWACDEGSDA